MRKAVKIISIIVASVALIVLAAYLFVMYMPQKSVAKQEANFVVTSKALANEYNTNQEASDKKYIDRIIQVTGTIAEISKDQNNDMVFILRDSETDTGILCTLDGSMAKKASKYKVGNNVTIKGACTGMLLEVVLNKCTIVK